MASRFVFPIITLHGPVEMICEYNESVEEFIDEVIHLREGYEYRSIKPTTLAVGHEQMKMLVAYTSYHLNRPTFPLDFEGIPIVVLNNLNYMDFLYDPQEATQNYLLQSLEEKANKDDEL